MLNYLIKNVKIVDGVSNESYIGDVGIIGDRITLDCKGDVNTEIDGTGLLICPGFIDVHRHADLTPFLKFPCEIEVRQGITTVINGNCGFSPFPCNADVAKFAEPILSSFPKEEQFNSAKDFFEIVENKSLAVNCAYLAGSGSARVYACKTKKEISENEFEKVLALLRQSLESGAIGISLGLMYTPEFYYASYHLKKIFSLVKEFGAIATVHLRGEGRLLISSLNEIIGIAKEVGNKLHISHFKVAGRANWGKGLSSALQIIDKGRKSGLIITYDAYPYTAGYTSLTTLLPPWAQEGGIDKIKQRINDNVIRQQIIAELKSESLLWDNLVCSTKFTNVIITASKNASYIGKSIESLSIENNVSSEEFALDLLVKENGKTGMIFYHMDELDVDKIICLEDSLIISDSLYLEGATYHPRVFGSFARVFSNYVKTNKLPLCVAVKKMTSYPAKAFSLENRGQIKEGYFADLVLLDYDKVKDNATYFEPSNYPSGINIVFVNGKLCLQNGKILQKNAGKLIKH